MEIGSLHLSPLCTKAVQDYFASVFSLTPDHLHDLTLTETPSPAVILDFYWACPQGQLISLGGVTEKHPLQEYVITIPLPCKFSTLHSALLQGESKRKQNYFTKWGPYLIDMVKRRAFHPPSIQPIELTEKEAHILHYLFSHSNQSIPRDDLLKNVWQYTDGLTTHTLETHIYRLRQKLPHINDLLVTTDKGYKIIS